ncbi:MAG: hypothetical protein RI988_3219 [Pseudomonadota bacterium]|jgi:predicted nucleic acid-binding protein
MILVDSSVWIDYLRGIDTPQADRLDTLLGHEPLAIGDLILTEVLQGIRAERQFLDVKRKLESLEIVTLCDPEVAVEAARNFQRLRALGITVRGTVDAVIATRCILSRHILLHSDRDFDPFEQHLGLKVLDCRA